MVRQIFRDNFLKYKHEKSLTQNQIAKLTGYPISTIASWCTGRTFPNAEAIDVICNAFSIKPYELFNDK